MIEKLIYYIYYKTKRYVDRKECEDIRKMLMGKDIEGLPEIDHNLLKRVAEYKLVKLGE